MAGLPARVLTCYYRPKPGGFCKRLFRAIEALLDAGHEVHYLAVVRFPIEHPKCRFHRFPWPASKTDTLTFWAIFQAFAPLMLLYLGIRHRITHAFAFGPTYGALLQPVRLLCRIPLVLFLRADTIENHRIKGRSRVLVALETLIEGFGIAGACVYGVSDDLVKTVTHRHTFLSPIFSGVLRNDVSSEIFSRNRHPQTPLRAAVVGVLEPRKNQQILLLSMEQIDGSLLRLDLYGSGPAWADLERQVRESGLSEKVNFMGWVDTSEIWPNVDLVLMPSLHEGAPNAVLEALAHGVPVLASDIPEHREILPSECLIPATSSAAWLSALSEVVVAPAERLSHMVELQRAAAQALRFDWNAAVVTRILDVPNQDSNTPTSPRG